MSTQTKNLQMTKPDVDEYYDINIQNENLDKIDTFCGRTDNPHNVTKSQVGLGNVPNVSTNDQTPTYTEASSNTALASGEKMSTAFSKIAKAVKSLIAHLSDTVGHITSAERTKWNAKLDATATAVNADKLDGLDSTAFATASQIKATGLTDDNLANLSIGVNLTFQELCNRTKVTFFTNWVDVTDFPINYGSGVMMPCSDTRYRMIYYGGAITNMRASYVGKATNVDGVWSVKWVESASNTDLSYYLPLAGGGLNGDIDMQWNKIYGCGGAFAPTLNDLYSHAGIELREKHHIGAGSTDIGYAPALGFHWTNTRGACIAMSADGNFHFIKNDGTYSTLKTGTANVIISDTAPADTTALWVS